MYLCVPCVILELPNFITKNLTEVLVTFIYLLTHVSNFRFVQNITRPVQHRPLRPCLPLHVSTRCFNPAAGMNVFNIAVAVPWRPHVSWENSRSVDWDFWQMTTGQWNSLASEFRNLLILVLYPNLHLTVRKFTQATVGRPNTSRIYTDY
jgi:hypothetical protein